MEEHGRKESESKFLYCHTVIKLVLLVTSFLLWRELHNVLKYIMAVPYDTSILNSGADPRRIIC